MTNNDNKRYFPLRDPENPFKVTLTPITEEQYRSLYPDIWATQKREQYHGRCMCPKYYLWKCDGQCDLCEYHAPDTVSLDEPLPDGNGTLGDYIPDSKPSIEDIYADRDLLKHLIARFRELDPDADRIIQMRLDNPTFLKQLQANIAKAVVNADTLSPDGIQARLEELQKELIKKANNKQDYDAIADEIFRLRDQKEQSELDSHHREELMKRIRELQDFIAGQETDITEFDEALVRKLIEKITVFADHFTVEFKSGITIDIEA